MFHLQAGVHLDEIKLTILIEELDRTGTDIVNVRHRIGTDFANFGAFFWRNAGARGLFKHLLVPTLQRAIPFAQMYRIALAIAKHLNFDVAWCGQVFFDINLVIAEVRFAFGTRGLKSAFHFGGTIGHLHALAATTCGGFDDYGVSKLFTDFQCGFNCRNTTIAAWNTRHTQCLHGVLGSNFVAHHPDMFGRRTNECQVMIFDDLYEIGVFGQEPIARVNRLGSGDFTGSNNRRHVKIAFASWCGADTNGFVRHAYMHGISVGGRMNRHRLDAHFATRADHAQGDFSAVGNEDFIKHVYALFDDDQRRAIFDSIAVTHQDTFDCT